MIFTISNTNINDSMIDMDVLININVMAYDGKYYINSVFQSNILNYLINNIQERNDKYNKDIEYNYKEMLRKIVLYKEYNTHSNAFSNSYNINNIIVDFGLIDINSLSISNSGLSFLLMSKHEQMLFLLVSYIKTYKLNENDVLYMVGVLVGNSNDMANNNIINYLIDIGMICVSDQNIIVNSKILTNDITNTDVITNSNLSNSDQYFYIESNYKIYAYTTDPCHLEILNLFSTLQLKMGRMVKCILDENKIVNTLDRGIDIDHIVRYIERHSYNIKNNSTISNNIVSNKNNILNNIINQLYIINNNRNRIHIMNGYLVDGFDNYNEYVSLLDKIGYNVLYRNDEERIIFIEEKYMDMLK